MAARAVVGIALTAGECAALEGWPGSHVLAHRTVVRASFRKTLDWVDAELNAAA